MLLELVNKVHEEELKCLSFQHESHNKYHVIVELQYVIHRYRKTLCFVLQNHFLVPTILLEFLKDHLLQCGLLDCRILRWAHIQTQTAKELKPDGCCLVEEELIALLLKHTQESQA